MVTFRLVIANMSLFQYVLCFTLALVIFAHNVIWDLFIDSCIPKNLL